LCGAIFFRRFAVEFSVYLSLRSLFLVSFHRFPSCGEMSGQQQIAIPTKNDLERHRDSIFFVEQDIIRGLNQLGLWSLVTPLHRVNALSCCKAAEHGWPAACFSCIEILTVLHSVLLRTPHRVDHVILSKGHAAAAQYALLFGEGHLSMDQLLRYKDGVGGLEAHADILCDTGSLGQCLSVVAGMATAAPDQYFAVVLGDGELQEGQNYEALMTIHHHNITNLSIIVDRNKFQSDTFCDEVMSIRDLPTVFRGFGFDTIHVQNGHDIKALHQAIGKSVEVGKQLHAANLEKKAQGKSGVGLEKQTQSQPQPSSLPEVGSAPRNQLAPIILVETVKGGGTAFMPTERNPATKQVSQPWHTRIPDWARYEKIISEQVENAKEELERLRNSLESRDGNHSRRSQVLNEAAAWIGKLEERWQHHRQLQLLSLSTLPKTIRPTFLDSKMQGTGHAFGNRLAALLTKDPFLAIVSADLVSSCGIQGAVGHERFFELGVAEQDAISFAAGLALTPKYRPIQGKEGNTSVTESRTLFPVVCTYSNFLKRGFENIFINLLENAHAIYAGYYSGLCYHTDGKSHQSFNDTSIFVGMPHLRVVDPINAEHAVHCLEEALRDQSRSYYFRLRRTPNLWAHAVHRRAWESSIERSSSEDEIEVPSVFRPFEVRPRKEVQPNAAGGQQPRCPNLIIVMGTVATGLALECTAEGAWAEGARVIVIPCLDNGTGPAAPHHSHHVQKRHPIPTRNDWEWILDGSPTKETDPEAEPQLRILVVEDDVGALHRAVATSIFDLGNKTALPHKQNHARHSKPASTWASARVSRLVGKSVNGAGPSCRNPSQTMEFFGFTVDALRDYWSEFSGPCLDAAPGEVVARRRHAKL
jgi:transketolase